MLNIGKELKMAYLVGLLAVLVFSLSLEPIRAVHFLTLVISTVDIHPVRIEPWIYRSILAAANGPKELSKTHTCTQTQAG